MKNKEIIKEIRDKIINNELKYSNSVIIGDNAVGKTHLLNLLAESMGNSKLINTDIDIQKVNKNTEIVLIDNIETILSLSDIFNINNYLDDKFNDKKKVLVTHNIHAISRLVNFNIIQLYSDNYCICDGNDFNSYEDVRNLMVNKRNPITTTLVNLLNLRLSNTWTSLEDRKLSEIKTKKLNKSQKLLLNEIEKDSV